MTTQHKIEAIVRVSEEELTKAGPDKLLPRVYEEASSRVKEQRLAKHLVPTGALMVEVVVEQWVEDE